MRILDDNPEKWTPRGTGRKIGVELEFCHPMGDDILDEQDWDYLLDSSYIPAVKMDGSVDGAELVTQPADLAIHKRNMPDVLTELKLAGFFADGTCGLHVHVERKSDANIRLTSMLLQLIMTAQSKVWGDFLSKIHGRDVSHHEYCGETLEFVRKPHQTLFERIPNCFNTAKYWSYLERGNKYWRINFQHHETYEFRMGHGSIRLERVLRRIEFALAAVTWVEEMGKKLFFTIMEQEVKMFADWIHQHDTEYPVLSRFLQEQYPSD